MNVGVTVTVPLTIILFVSGVYCPPMEGFPSRYTLRSCKSDSELLRLDTPDATFEIVKSERNPRKYCLIEKLPDSTTTQKCCFRKRELEFVSLMDAEITMMIYPTNDPDNPRKITCVFQRTSLARKFYIDMTHELPNEKVLLMMASYLLKSDDTEVGTEVFLYVDCFENYATIVMKDLDDNPLLIFSTSAVSQIQRDSTEIILYINTNTDEQVFYTLGFTRVSLTLVCNELLHWLCRHIIRTTSAEANGRLLDDPLYQRTRNRIDQALQRQIDRNQSRISEYLGRRTH